MVRQGADPFEIAREALRMVGRFGTPPTPEIFEVWYRYIEGHDQDIADQLRHVVNEVQSVDVATLEQIHRQYCVEVDSVASEATDTLASELKNVRQLLGSQRSVGQRLDAQLEAVGDTIRENAHAATLRTCASTLADEGKRLQTELQQVDSRLEKSEAAVASLRTSLSESRQQLMTDPLTGIGNRRYFDWFGNHRLGRWAARNEEIYLTRIDLDHFRKINEAHGHDAGDRLLQFVASEISKLRPEVQLSRTGGDEFSAFVDQGDRDAAVGFADEVRQWFSDKRLTLSEGDPEPVTVKFSIGGARLHQGDDTAAWFSRAGKFLDEAKNIGRDRAIIER